MWLGRVCGLAAVPIEQLRKGDRFIYYSMAFLPTTSSIQVVSLF